MWWNPMFKHRRVAQKVIQTKRSGSQFKESMEPEKWRENKPQHMETRWEKFPAN